MQPNAVLKNKGMRVLSEHLGIVEAERFIALLSRERFDYTQWSQDLFVDVPLEQLLSDAQAFREELNASSDPFYSESNIEVLEQSIRDADEGRLTEHELIEE